jgi:hypothetical protein
MVLVGAGAALVLSALILAVLMARRQRATPATGSASAGAPGGFDEDYDGYGGNFESESAYMPAAGWDDDEQGGWDEGGYDDGASMYGPAQSGRYGGAPGGSSYRAPNRRGGLLSGQRGGDDYDDEDDGGPPQRRGGAPGRSSPGGSRYRR